MMAAMKPAPSLVSYQPIDLPIKPASSAPAIPRRTVTMQPAGVLAGHHQLGDSPGEPADNDPGEDSIIFHHADSPFRGESFQNCRFVAKMR